MIRSLSPEDRRFLLWAYGACFVCSFPFIFLCWWLHTWAALALLVIFSIGFGSRSWPFSSFEASHEFS